MISLKISAVQNYGASVLAFGYKNKTTRAIDADALLYEYGLPFCKRYQEILLQLLKDSQVLKVVFTDLCVRGEISLRQTDFEKKSELVQYAKEVKKELKIALSSAKFIAEKDNELYCDEFIEQFNLENEIQL